MSDCPVIIKNVRKYQSLRIMSDTLSQLNNLRLSKDIDGICKFFTEGQNFDLHPADFCVLYCGDIILMFCHHTFRDENIIAVVYENMIYEFVAKHGHELFLGGATNTIYTMNKMTQNPKPVYIYSRLHYSK